MGFVSEHMIVPPFTPADTFILFVYRERIYKWAHPSVECIICGRNGPGFEGTAMDIIKAYGPRSHNWQLSCCLNQHVWECACGKFYPTSLALGSHNAANRRHHIEGHGRMDKVGHP